MNTFCKPIRFWRIIHGGLFCLFAFLNLPFQPSFYSFLLFFSLFFFYLRIYPVHLFYIAATNCVCAACSLPTASSAFYFSQKKQKSVTAAYWTTNKNRHTTITIGFSDRCSNFVPPSLSFSDSLFISLAFVRPVPLFSRTLSFSTPIYHLRAASHRPL